MAADLQRSDFRAGVAPGSLFSTLGGFAASSSSSGDLVYSNGVFRPNQPGANPIFFGAAAPAAADYSVRALVKCLGTTDGDFAAILIRAQPGLAGYVLMWTHSTFWGPGLRLIRFPDGPNGMLGQPVQSSPAGDSLVPVAGATLLIEVAARGTNLDIFANGAKVATVTDSAYTAAGVAGLWANTANAGDSNGYGFLAFAANQDPTYAPATFDGPLASIAVTPAAPQVPGGTTQQFAATGTYADGSTADLTALAAWATTLANATVPGGLLEAPAATSSNQSGSVTATYGGQSGSTTVTVPAVAPPTVGAITITSADGYDTITYPAPTAGTYPVARVWLMQGTASGGESTAVRSHASAAAGTFVVPSGGYFYIVTASDGQNPANTSAPSNEVQGAPASADSTPVTVSTLRAVLAEFGDAMDARLRATPVPSVVSGFAGYPNLLLQLAGDYVPANQQSALATFYAGVAAALLRTPDNKLVTTAAGSVDVGTVAGAAAGGVFEASAAAGAAAALAGGVAVADKTGFSLSPTGIAAVADALPGLSQADSEALAQIPQIAQTLTNGVVLAAHGLDNIPTTPPVRGLTPTFPQMQVMTWRRNYRANVWDKVQRRVTGYADDGVTVLYVQPYSDTANTTTTGNAQ